MFVYVLIREEDSWCGQLDSVKGVFSTLEEADEMARAQVDFKKNGVLYRASYMEVGSRWPGDAEEIYFEK
jgi:hypothetical protein